MNCIPRITELGRVYKVHTARKCDRRYMQRKLRKTDGNAMHGPKAASVGRIVLSEFEIPAKHLINKSSCASYVCVYVCMGDTQKKCTFLYIQFSW